VHIEAYLKDKPKAANYLNEEIATLVNLAFIVGMKEAFSESQTKLNEIKDALNGR
jgi:hypothetical protein